MKPNKASPSISLPEYEWEYVKQKLKELDSQNRTIIILLGESLKDYKKIKKENILLRAKNLDLQRRLAEAHKFLKIDES